MANEGAELKDGLSDNATIVHLEDPLGQLGHTALQVKEAHFHAFLEESPDTTIIVDQTGRINYASRRITSMFGYQPVEVLGAPVDVLIPERYRKTHYDHMVRFMKNPQPRMMRGGMDLLALRKDRSEFLAEISLSLHPTPGGLLVVAAVRDLEATKRVQRLVLAELHHRLKNTLAIVIAITSQSLRNARDLEEGRLAVESRLLALGRAHDLLMEESSSSTKLTDVIRCAVRPFDCHDGHRFSVQVMDIDIDPGAVLPIAMSINELCTNAVKYGALSNSTGHIDIRSIVDEKAQSFRLTWTERGGPAVREPTRCSFGTRLLTRLAQQLQGEMRLVFEPEGVIYQLDVPLDTLHFGLHAADRSTL